MTGPAARERALVALVSVLGVLGAAVLAWSIWETATSPTSLGRWFVLVVTLTLLTDITAIDLRVKPAAMETLSQELADCPEVVSLYIMSDLQSLHIHTLTDNYETFDRFVRERIFNRPEILSVDCKTLMTRVKHRRGGARL